MNILWPKSTAARLSRGPLSMDEYLLYIFLYLVLYGYSLSPILSMQGATGPGEGPFIPVPLGGLVSFAIITVIGWRLCRGANRKADGKKLFQKIVCFGIPIRVCAIALSYVLNLVIVEAWLRLPFAIPPTFLAYGSAFQGLAVELAFYYAVSRCIPWVRPV